MKRGINKEILKLAIPSIFANITVPLVGMVDIAVAGHIGGEAGITGGFTTAALIGGIAIGTMLFDLLYWNFGFLRVSTGGLTAQAYGRWQAALAAMGVPAGASASSVTAGLSSSAAGDAERARRDCADSLLRSIGIAMGTAFVLIAIQWIFVQAAFLVVKCTPEVRQLATQYFFIRIWAAPATLSLMAFKGWFIGMQDSVSAMVTDLVVNGVNILASFFLSLGFAWMAGGNGWHGLGFAGVALGTVTAQYAGLLCAVIFLLVKYRKKVFSNIGFSDFARSFKGADTGKFFSMNGDVFVRSLCFIAIYIGYTIISARYGDVLLATCSIMMKLLMIFSYFTDGFAYAGEAMTGKYIGAKDRESLSQSIRWNFVWCGGLSVLFMFIYGFGGVPLLKMMTTDPVVVAAAKAYIPWLLLMPVAGCAAFAWDGIYIGATSTVYVRNAMIWATVAFFVVWFGGIWFFNPSTAVAGFHATDESAVHLLMAAYFAHLLARTVVLTLRYKKAVYGSLA